MSSEPTHNSPADNADSVDENGTTNDNGMLRPPGAPVLAPRPVYRPHVDSHTAHAFRRPAGQSGSFAARGAGTESTAASAPKGPPEAVLAEAFGRPSGSTELLQRDPDAVSDKGPVAGPADPWRDPDSLARLGAPAVGSPTTRELPPPSSSRPGRSCSVRG